MLLLLLTGHLLALEHLVDMLGVKLLSWGDREGNVDRACCLTPRPAEGLVEVGQRLGHLEQQDEAPSEEVDADGDLHCRDHDLGSFVTLVDALLDRDEVRGGDLAVEEEDRELLLVLAGCLGTDLA